MAYVLPVLSSVLLSASSEAVRISKAVAKEYCLIVLSLTLKGIDHILRPSPWKTKESFLPVYVGSLVSHTKDPAVDRSQAVDRSYLINQPLSSHRCRIVPSPEN
jgi:hypothetical protein